MVGGPTLPGVRSPFAAVAAVALVAVAGCSSSSLGARSSVTTPPLSVAPSVSQVAFLLTGSAPQGADITYSFGDGGTEQQQGVDVPLVMKDGTVGMHFTVPIGGDLYFLAQNNAGGSLTCEIDVNGTPVSTHTSTVDGAVVVCSGTA